MVTWGETDHIRHDSNTTSVVDETEEEERKYQSDYDCAFSYEEQ